MNDEGPAWAAALIIVVWLWSLAVFVPAFFMGKSRVVAQIVHWSGVVATAMFAVFWLSLLESDSDAIGFVIAPFAVLGFVAWSLRRYRFAALLYWVAVGILAFSDAAYMAFYGPLELALVSGVAALMSKTGERRPATA